MKCALALVLCGYSVAGCGIGSTDTVEEIQSEDLAALNQTSTTTTTVPETAPAVETTPGSVEATSTTIEQPASTVPAADVTLYFITGSQLTAVDVPLPVGAKERAILEALGSVPPDEFEAGIRSAVVADLVAGFRIANSRAIVDLDGELFRDIPSDDQRLTVAQIVLTLTRLPAIEEVLFTTDGEPLLVYERGNEVTDPGEPVTRADYEELVVENERRRGDPPATNPALRFSAGCDGGE